MNVCVLSSKKCRLFTVATGVWDFFKNSEVTFCRLLGLPSEDKGNWNSYFWHEKPWKIHKNGNELLLVEIEGEW